MEYNTYTSLSTARAGTPTKHRPISTRWPFISKLKGVKLLPSIIVESDSSAAWLSIKQLLPTLIGKGNAGIKLVERNNPD